MELLVFLIPGYILLHNNLQKQGKGAHTHKRFFLSNVDGYQFSLRVAYSSFLLGIFCFIPIKSVGAIAYFACPDKLNQARNVVHEIIGIPYAITFFSMCALAVFSQKIQFLFSFFSRLIAPFISTEHTPYNDVIERSVKESQGAMFLKLKSNTYLIGRVSMAMPTVKEDQITIVPFISGSKRKMSQDEINEVHFLYSMHSDANLHKLRFLCDREYLVFATGYKLDDEANRTIYFIRLADIEYMSAFKKDVHDEFIYKGKTIQLVKLPNEFNGQRQLPLNNRDNQAA